jgi:hypothetical protein
VLTDVLSGICQRCAIAVPAALELRKDQTGHIDLHGEQSEGPAAGMMPQPAIGSAQWWVLRPAWLGLLTVVLVPMIMRIRRQEVDSHPVEGRREINVLCACGCHAGGGR